MKTMNKVFVAVAMVAGLVSNSAYAGGFFGDLINQVAPGVGTQLDQINKNAGQPFDHAAAAALNTFVPGSGAALEAGWAIQRSGVLNGGLPGNMGNFCSTPVGAFPGPWNPVGMPCGANTPRGFFQGRVVNLGR